MDSEAGFVPPTATGRLWLQWARMVTTVCYHWNFPMFTTHRADLTILLDVVRPASLLLIDPAAIEPPPVGADCRVTHLRAVDPVQLAALDRHDLGVVANTLERLDRKTGGLLLGRLRDLLTRRFVVLVPLGAGWEGLESRWEMADLLGYGMSLMVRYQENGWPLGLFHYAIESYKTTPEWFNSRHWAHPERWKP